MSTSSVKVEKRSTSTTTKATLLDILVESSTTNFMSKVPTACSDLPKYEEGKFYFHQSYKTEDESTWDPRWVIFRNRWINLHPDWVPLFWTDESLELLWNCTVRLSIL